jgi:WD40 repeat protein
MTKNTQLLLILIALGLLAMLLCCTPLALLALFRLGVSDRLASGTTAQPPSLQQAEARRPTQQRPGEQPETSKPGVELKKRQTLVRQDQVFDGVTVSPDGRILAVRTLVEGTIRLIPILEPGMNREMPLKEPVDRLTFSPDGKTLALGHTFSGKIRLCDVEAAAIVGEVTHADKRFMDIAWLPDGNLLVIGPDRTSIWDGKKKMTTGSVATPKARGIPLYCVAPAGQFVACPGEKPGEVITWDPRTGKSEVLAPPPGAPFARVEGIAISTDGTKVAIEGPDQGVELWDTGERKRIGTINAGAVRGMTFSPDGRFLLCSDGSGAITFWNTETQKAEGKTDTQSTPATKWFFTDDGKRLIPCKDNAKEIFLWDLVETK